MNIQVLKFDNNSLVEFEKIKLDIVKIINQGTIKEGGEAEAELLSLDELNDALEGESEEIITFSDNHITETVKPNKNKKVRNFSSAKTDDIVLTRLDTVENLQKKIYCITGIDPYRQHLYYKTNEHINMFYTLYDSNNTEIKSTIYDAINGDSVINVPIFKDLDVNKIEGYDRFTIIETLLNQDINTLYLVDLYDLLGISDVGSNTINTNRLKEIVEYSTEIFYGLIINYFPVIDMNVFNTILGDSIRESYPSFAHNPVILIQKYKNEKKMLESISSKKCKYDIKLSTAVVETIVTMNINTYINLRAVVDNIKLTDQISSVHYKLLFDKNYLYLIKHRKEDNIKPVNIKNDSIIIRAVLENNNIDLIITNEHYKISVIWNESMQLSFMDIKKAIVKTINPIIENINEQLEKPLPLVDFTVGTINRMNVNIYWKQIVPSDEKDKVVQVFKELVGAGYLIRNNNVNGEEYYITYGVKYDPRIFMDAYLNSYYYLLHSTPEKQFHNLYTKKKIIKLLFRSSDVKMELLGLSEAEYNNVISYILPLLSDLKFSKLVKVKTNKKKLTKLKDEDPVLYSTKLYKDFVYSRICQEPFQPDMYTENEYKILSADKKNKQVKNAVEYKNFTNGEKAYYACPDKYPYLQLITGKHPKNYCVPCCRSTPLIGENKDTFNKCKSSGVYETEKQSNTGRYVMIYGKDIDEDRLSNIPEDTIDAIIHNNVEVAKEYKGCRSRYYIYGVKQIMSGNKIGLLFALAKALNIPERKFLEFIIDTTECIFYALLGGNIVNYFKSSKELINDIISIIEGYEIKKNYVPWNDIIMDIMKYSKLNLIVFRDDGDKNIYLDMPDGLSNVNDFINKESTYIILLNKEGHFYPIFLIDFSKFKTKGEIHKRVFNIDDGILKSLRLSVETWLKQNSIPDTSTFVLENFCKKHKYTINNLFINFSDICYAVLIKTPKGYIYIPTNTPYNKIKDYKIEFEPFNRKKFHINIKESFKVMKDYCKFINKPFDIETVVVHGTEVLGYQLTGFITLTRASGQVSSLRPIIPKGTDIKELGYDLDDVQSSIYYRKNPKEDNRIRNHNDDMYYYSIYKLLVLHLSEKWSAEINHKKREEINKFICKKKYKQIEITEFLRNFCEEDYKIILALMNKFGIHKNKNILLNDIAGIQFEFDKKTLNKVDKLDYANLKRLMVEEIKDITVNKNKLKEIEIPNVLTTCKLPQSYCQGKKLMLDYNKLDDFAELLTYQLKNPVQRKYISNIKNLDTIINKNRFIKGDDVITIV